MIYLSTVDHLDPNCHEVLGRYSMIYVWYKSELL